MKPSDFLAGYLDEPGDAPVIGAPGVIKQIQLALLALIPAFKLFRLPPATRRSFAGKGFAARRDRSLKFARFLDRRPDCARQIAIPAETYRLVLDKDEATDGLRLAVLLGREAIEHAALLLQSSISRRCRAVIRFVMARFIDSEATPEERRMRDAFLSVVQPVCEGEAASASKARRDRAAAAAEKEAGPEAPALPGPGPSPLAAPETTGAGPNAAGPRKDRTTDR